MKKVYCLGLAIILCFLVSCTGVNKTTNGNISLSSKGEFPISKTPSSLNVMIRVNDNLKNIDTNTVTKWYENKTNVKINWTRVNSSDVNQKISLMLATQSDLPDVFLNCILSSAQLVEYGGNGTIVPLNDLIEKQGSFVNRMFDYNKSIKEAIISPNGNIYSLPLFAETYHVTMPQKMWINKKWLDNLGLSIPETTEEFKNVLKAFKEKDPNRNGKKDEVPLATTNGWYANLDGFLMNPFIYSDGPYTNKMILENDNVKPAYMQDGWREGLRYIKNLYDEGLIDKEAFISDATSIKMLTGNKDGNKLGAIPSGSMGQFVDVNTDVKNEFIVLPPLKGPNGIRQTAYFPTNPVQGYAVITKACKNPELAFKWIDGIYSKTNEWFGAEGVDWKKPEVVEKGVLNMDIDFVLTPVNSEPANGWWYGVTPPFQSFEERNNMPKLKVWNEEEVLFNATRQYEPYKRKEELLPVINYTKDELIEIDKYKTSIDEFVKKSTADFVLGAKNLDDYWGKYKSDLSSLNVEKIVEIIQTAYKRQYKK